MFLTYTRVMRGRLSRYIVFGPSWVPSVASEQSSSATGSGTAEAVRKPSCLWATRGISNNKTSYFTVEEICYDTKKAQNSSTKPYPLRG